jgi:hypothetical protein
MRVPEQQLGNRRSALWGKAVDVPHLSANLALADQQPPEPRQMFGQRFDNR